jgi:plasmid stabilization system protein ParE
MIIAGREITLTDYFLAQLAEIQMYISEESPLRGRQLTTDLFDFLTDTIAPNPFMFVEYLGKSTVEKLYRRAVFRKNYIVIYKVTDSEILFLTVHHASRNPDSIDLNE